MVFNECGHHPDEGNETLSLEGCHDQIPMITPQFPDLLSFERREITGEPDRATTLYAVHDVCLRHEIFVFEP